MSLAFSRVFFRHEGAASPLFEDLTLEFPPRWTGVVGANGSGKTTLLRLAQGELLPSSGNVASPGRRRFCPQGVALPPVGWVDLLRSPLPRPARLRAELELDPSWEERWETLSPGERKRVQIGVALLEEPDLLLLDEPTNHLDRQARDLLLRSLRRFGGVGLLVSHDRELLDVLAVRCLFLDPPRAILLPGNYTAALRVREEGRRAAREAYERDRRELVRLEKERRRRREEADRADRKRSKRDLAPRDSDGRERLDRARVTGRDGLAGRLLRQMEGRLAQRERDLEAREVRRPEILSFRLPGSRSSRNRLLDLPGGGLSLGGGRWLRFPDLRLEPGDRVALTGPNGSGKTTLLRHLLPLLNVPPDRVLYLPQELEERSTRELIEAFRHLDPRRRGLAGAVMAGLGSSPDALLSGPFPSPGELRKGFLALGALADPQVLVLDEPTNHLDLPATLLLERALVPFPGALILVSHDEVFLRTLTTRCWHLSREEGTSRLATEGPVSGGSAQREGNAP